MSPHPGGPDPTPTAEVGGDVPQGGAPTSVEAVRSPMDAGRGDESSGREGALPRVPRRSRLLLRSAIVLAPLVALALGLGTPLGAVDAMWLGILLLPLPLLALAQAPLAGIVRLERIPAYASSTVTILVLGAISSFVGIRGFGVPALGLVPLPAGAFAAWTLGLVAVALLLIGLFHGIGRIFGIPESPTLAHLLPRTPTERGLFVGLSLAAGTGEEIAYRGYAITAAAAFLPGPWWATALTSVSFGLVHAYQGSMGMVRSGLLGFCLGGSFVVTGSLLPAMAAHALVDLIGGLWLGEKLVGTGDEVGPREVPDPPPGPADGGPPIRQ